MMSSTNISKFIIRVRPQSKHIVIDTLNLTHSLLRGKKINATQILRAITDTAPVLIEKYPGRVMYVIKDQTSIHLTPETRLRIKASAVLNKVYIYIAEQYINPPSGVKISSSHSAGGRDDFFMAILASKWRCSILTDDKLKDFADFRSTIQPFYVVEYNYWQHTAKKEYIRPESVGYIRLQRPHLVNPYQIFS
jgi:hypothetical protein